MEESLTRQEVFNTVYTHLLKQNAKSTNGAGTCMYRGENGRSCAIGCLIKDEEYHPCMDGKENTPHDNKIINCNVESLHIHKVFPERLVPHLGMLMSLQHIHDQGSVFSWESRLCEYAKINGLTIPV